MTTGTIVLYRYKHIILNNIVTLSLYKPSPYKFYSPALQSGGFNNNKSIPELILEIKNKKREYKLNEDQFYSARADYKNLIKAKVLDSKLSDKSKNTEMKDIMRFYDSYFDEESGNTREEGIKELEVYLVEEIQTAKKNTTNLIKEIKELHKDLETKKALEENKNILPPIIAMYNPILFSILLTIFSCCISFNLIDFNLNYFIFHILDVVIPTIMISTVLFAWESYRLYSKVRRYYNAGKTIYIFCKNWLIKILK